MGTPRRLSSDERVYLSARGAALTGGAIVETMVPLIVVLTLGGGPTAVAGVMVLIQGLSLSLRLPIATWVDKRGETIKMQAWSHMGAALSVALIPLLFWLDKLNYPTLVFAVLVTIVFKTLTSTIGYATVYVITGEGRRTEFMGRLNSVSGVAEIGGQSAGPLLLRFLPPPVILLADTVLGIAAATLVARIGNRRDHLDAAGPDVPDNDIATLGALRKVMARRSVKLLCLYGAAGALSAPGFLIYALTTLEIPAATMGLVLATGALGGIAGGLLVGRLIGRAGLDKTLSMACAASAVAVPVVFAGELWRPLSYPGLVLFEMALAFCGTLVVASVFGSIQETVPRGEIARAMAGASVGLEAAAISPLLLGGGIAEAAGIRVPFVLTGLLFLGLALYSTQPTFRRVGGKP